MIWPKCSSSDVLNFRSANSEEGSKLSIGASESIDITGVYVPGHPSLRCISVDCQDESVTGHASSRYISVDCQDECVKGGWIVNAAVQLRPMLASLHVQLWTSNVYVYEYYIF